MSKFQHHTKLPSNFKMSVVFPIYMPQRPSSSTAQSYAQISKCLRYFWSICHSVKVSAPQKATLKFRNVCSISDLFATVSKFQHHTKLPSNFEMSAVFPTYLSQCPSFSTTQSYPQISKCLQYFHSICHSVQVTAPHKVTLKFQNVCSISDLSATVSKFQHHTKLHSKCSTLLVSSLN
jgi:hypothetical protein